MADGGTARPHSLVAAVAWFELRLTLRSPVFWIVVAISTLMVVGSLTVERIQVGPLRSGTRTTVEAVLYVHLTWSLFFLFTAAAFAGEAALRDEQTGFGPIVRATPAPAQAVMLGRFLGALLAVLLSFASVPVATALAPLAPWTPPGAVPPPSAAGLLYGTAVFAVPNLFLATALFMALANAARSPIAGYLGAVALLVLYGLGSGGAASPEPSPAMVLAEPFGFAAYRSATADWAQAERAARLPVLWGAIGLNRLLWLALGGAALAFALRGPGRAAPTRSRPVERTSGDRPPAARPPTPARAFGPATALAQFAARTRFETGQILRSPFLAVLILLGLASVLGALWPLPAGTPRPAALARVDEAFRLVPIVVATFWAGELLWSERERSVGDLIGTAPAPDWIFLAPKILALALVLALSLLSVALAAAVFEAWRGGEAGFTAWLLLYGLPRTWDALLLAALAVFFQTVSPGKLAGFGLMVLYLIASLAMETAGLRGDFYRYGGGETLAAHPGSAPALLVRGYWTAAAGLLLILAHLLVGRGPDTRLAPRFGRLRRRLRGLPGVLAAGAALAWLALGAALAAR